MVSDNEGDFIKRWSRRKTEERKTEERKSGERDQQPDSEAENLPAEAQDGTGLEPDATGDQQTEIETAELEEADFDDVDFEMLDFSSDFTRFMKKGVPESIQRRALRKLWGSDPILANIDGLNDYDEDYTNKGMAIKALKTAYKVGSGYLSEEDYNTDEVPDKKDEAGVEDVTATDDSAERGEEQSAVGTDGKDNIGDMDETDNLSQDEQKTAMPDVEEKQKG